ncbi:MAG: S-layer homology domain-containing protein [Defluviitaleaceae bacterium]|nr:S-layer homology domain-containing protein [Defluviitaleaceae bacterium]MCL2240738.1 S-layer homology domain-containing protein [Defluviitaleaceae bacterium]
MRVKILARIAMLAMALMLLFPMAVFARPDRFILNDPVLNTYTGRPNVAPLIRGLAFPDLPPNLAQRDAIVRGGALGVFMPEGGNFNPAGNVPRGQALTYIVRAAGLSEDARERTAAVAPTLPEGTALPTVWLFSYMQQARDMGLITAAEYNDAVAALTLPAQALNVAAAVPAPIPFHTVPATREEIAFWLYTAFTYAEEDIFDGPQNQPGQSVFPFADWSNITPARAAAVEAMVRNGIMIGQTATSFAPLAPISRAHLAQTIRNLDTLHFSLLGLERVTGTVGEVVQEQFVDTLTGQSWHNVYVRRADGGVDVLRSTQRMSPSPQDGPLDTVVLRNGQVSGLTGLQLGDQIEYIVHTESDTVWYVRVMGEMNIQNFVGRLRLIDIAEGTMTFTDPNGRSFTFNMIYGMYGTNADGVPFIRFSNIQRPADTLPMGSLYNVTLVNNLITDIEFLGDPVLYNEIRGIVTENNPNLGFITIIDENRRERTFNYIPGTLQVQRRDFYDMREAGWNRQALQQGIDEILPGDIVSIRVADDDPARVTHISAAAQTTTRYGRVRELRPRGGYYEMLMEFPGGQTAWFTVVDGILVLEHGRPVSANAIRVGDWAQIRVNQALLGPGHMMESVLEVALDGGGHHISTIVMGQLSRFTPTQNQLQIVHAQELTPAGWSNHRPLAQFSIGGADVDYFFDGRPVSLSFLSRYLQRGSGTVYMALENNFAGERVTMVSVRSGRDELLRPETILSASGGNFSLLGIPGNIQTDDGTIVVRDGRLVDAGNIAANDWARVSLNGHNTAAVVDISQAPATDGIQIVRGRVQRVWPHHSFRVETMSSFDGMRWHYTPIPRIFTIDHDTIFMIDGAIGSIDNFIGFTEASVVGQVFNVIVEGGRAAWVIQVPFTEPIPSLPTAPGHLALRGTIFDVGGGVRLRDVTVFNPQTGAWMPISLVDPTADVSFQSNTIIIDRDRMVSANSLRVGQQIRVFTNMPLNTVTIGSGMSANGYMVFVES